MSLRDVLAEEIARAGPIDVARYMSLALDHPQFGYYATRPALGPEGDFITAPQVSQMFGELLGLWAAQVWMQMGSPSPVVLAEIGPGECQMISDALRAARAVPGFREAVDLWLVEPSAPLAARQRQALAEVEPPPSWVSSHEALPGGAPLLILSNEALDCLPIRQAVRVDDDWRERRIALGEGGGLCFVAAEAVFPPGAPEAAPDGAVFEWSPALDAFGEEIGAQIAACGGAALFIDYGRDAPDLGDTLQALGRHRRRDPLASPGEDDLTAHVDFPGFLAAARRAGAAVTRIATQADFLRALGIELRADRLARSRPDRADQILRQLRRLVAPDQMGLLFKAAAVLAPGIEPPGLELAA